MARKIFLPIIFLLLLYGFWLSPDFKSIAAGLAIFLYGMIVLEQGFKSFTGGTLENILRKSTNKLWKSITFGVITTAAMQSSTLVSLLTISFLSAGLLGLVEGMGIVFGANLGTTTGAWIIATLGLKVKISSYAMPLLVFGVLFILQSSKVLTGIGYGLLGMGLLFLGIHFLKEGFEAIQHSVNLEDYAVAGYPGLFLFALVGIVITIITQSSHATLALIITALAAQQITYDNALAVAIGANVGTTITGVLASISANVNGKRLAVAHLIFNVITGFIAIVFIQPLLWAVDNISIIIGIGAQNFTLKLALFHTLFNVLGLMLVIPFIDKIKTLLVRLLPTPIIRSDKPKYLNEATMQVPAAAVESIRKELIHLYDNSFRIITKGISISRHAIVSNRVSVDMVKNTQKLVSIDIDEAYTNRIKDLHSAIIEFISHLQAQQIPVIWSDELYALREASRHCVESVKAMKHLHKNLSCYGITQDPEIRGQYDKIRLSVAKVLTEIAVLRYERDDDADATIVSLDLMKMHLIEFDRKFNEALGELIRNKRITPQMATSLMNDSAYAYTIGTNLIKMAQTIFLIREKNLKQAAQQMTLDDAEIKSLLESRD